MDNKPLRITILKNARFYTGDPRRPWAAALALAGNRIVALDNAVAAWEALPGATGEDLQGATVIPGLTDAHIHLMWYGLSLQALDLRDLSRDGTLRAVRQQAELLPPGTWIQGRGWDQNLWPDPRFLTAGELDIAAPRHPVALIAKSAHALAANSAALRLAGITADTPDPRHGRIGRRADGSPDGTCFEDAMELILDAIPAPTVEDVAAALDQAQRRLLAFGITGVHDVDGNPAFAAFQTLRQCGELRIRVNKYVRLEALEGALAAGLRTGFGDDHLRLGGLKLFSDGALGPRTGALFTPYEGEPDNLGLLTLEPEQLLEIARRAANGGLALMIHAIGDRANRLVLDVLEAVRPLAPELRHRIEHAQLLTPQDFPRAARLGIVVSMQPTHAIHDIDMAERYWGRRSEYAYAWRSFLETGATLAFGSDAPIEVFDPFLGLYAAVTRRREDGAPGPDGWVPAQKLTLHEALRAFTWGAAYAAGMEDRLGLLQPGYLADLAVLDRDIFAQPPEALRETRVTRTMVDGAWQTF